MPISALTRVPACHMVDKSFPKKIFRGVQPYFEISLLSFIQHNSFGQNFYRYETVYLVRIWTYKKRTKKSILSHREAKT